MSDAPRRRPYWLDDGTESCHACTHHYIVQMEYRCVACDRGVCCHCVNVEITSGAMLCPSCHRDGGDE